MKVRQFLVPVTLLAMLACSKDKYQSYPQITLETINTLVPVGGGLEAKFQFTQKPGKLSGGTFTAIRNRLNQQPLPVGTAIADTVIGPIPSFPDENQGEFDFTLDYNYLHESDTENDTIMFKFSCVDRDGNKSDTISSPTVVVLYQ